MDRFISGCFLLVVNKVPIPALEALFCSVAHYHRGFRNTNGQLAKLWSRDTESKLQRKLPMGFRGHARGIPLANWSVGRSRSGSENRLVK